MLGLAGCGQPAEPQPAAAPSPAPAEASPEAPAVSVARPPLRLSKPEPSEYPHIEHLLQISDRLYSGGEPHGEEAFAELARLGVNIVVSVDGARPNIEAAGRHSLRYVHIPIGYDGISAEACGALARLMRETADSGETLYFHCHHGVHRGPAAAAAASIAAGLADRDEALEVLRAAGTRRGYAGLWRDVEGYQTPPADAVLPPLVEVAEVDSLVAAMAQLDRANDHLKLCQAAGWTTPPAHPDVVPAQQALLVREAFHEATRHAAEDYDEQFVAWLLESEAMAVELEAELSAGNTAAAGQVFTRLGQACLQCHQEYRD